MSELYRELGEQTPQERKQNLSKRIKTANELYGRLEEEGILFFDDNCKGNHLPVWNRILRHMPIAP